LTSGTTYYFRVKATGCNGSTLSTILNFTPNTAPTFVTSSPTLTVCQNASTTDIKSLLHVNDPDAGQTETWSQQVAPVHGTLSFSSATASSGSTNITPGGTITYAPTSGYSGTDVFTVHVSDGSASANVVVNVTVNPLPSAITGTFTLPAGTNSQLSSPTGGGSWISGSGSVASITSSGGLLSGLTVGTSLIAYTVSGCSVSQTVTVNAAASSLTWYSKTTGGDASVLANWWSNNNNTGYQPSVFSTDATTWNFQSSMTSTAALTFEGNVAILSGGTFIPLSLSTTSVGGNWSNAGSFTHNSGTVSFTGANTASSSYTLSGTMTGSSAFNNLTFGSATNSYSCGSSAIDVGGNFVLSAGTLTAPSANMTITGNFTQSSGSSFTPGSGTVIMNGLTKSITAASMNTATTSCFNNLSFNAASATTYTINSNLRLMGNLTNLTSNGTIALGAHTLTISGSFANPGPALTGASSIVFNGSSTVTATGNR